MIRFEGKSKAATTIPNKPTPTGFKVWAIAQKGFLWNWNFHISGSNNGPIDVKTPRELGGTKTGKGGNKTQAVAFKLIQSLPGSGYHIFMDNLFTSNKFFDLLAQNGVGATGTCRSSSGVITQLIEFKKSDSKDTVPWGTFYALPTPSNRVLQTAWKDNAVVLAQTNVIPEGERVTRLRSRPKATSSKAKTSRVPFGDEPQKNLPIPKLYDEYNYQMGAVDQHDQLVANMPGLRRVRRGGAQAIEHWLLLTVLVNCYLISYHTTSEQTPDINFRSQKDFRNQLIESLLSKAKALDTPARKRSISKVDPERSQILINEHVLVKLPARKRCICCSGMRYGDKPQKRVALSELAHQNKRNSDRKDTSYGCQQCDVPLCKKRGCFEVFHSNK